MGAALTEPRTGGSFRDAGQRLFRQEAAAPSMVTRLLGPQRVAVREPANDEDAWAPRLAALSTLGQYDGLVVTEGDPARATRAYNVPDDPLDDAAIRIAVADARARALTGQIHAAVTLTDGRTAGALLLFPLMAGERVTGMMIALRVGRAFGTADAFTACSVAELVVLDLARSAAIRREAIERRQALALYELGRIALFGDEPRDILHEAVALLASALDHEVAHLWLLRPDGALQLRAAHSKEGLPLEIARPGDHAALAEALEHRRVVRRDATSVAWVPPGTRELIVAPLVDAGRPLGVLVLGHSQQRYGAEDEEFADVVAGFIARLVVRTARGTTGRRTELRESRPAAAEDHADWVDEGQLTGS